MTLYLLSKLISEITLSNLNCNFDRSLPYLILNKNISIFDKYLLLEEKKKEI